MSNDTPVDGPDTPEPHDETQPIGAATPAESPSPAAPEPVLQPTPPGSTVPAASEPAAKQHFADRLWGLRSMIAVALAAVILGGVAGAAIAKAGEGGDQRAGFGPCGRHGGFGHRGGPGGFGNRGPGGFGQDGPRGGFGRDGRGRLGVVPPTPSVPSTPSTPSKKS